MTDHDNSKQPSKDASAGPRIDAATLRDYVTAIWVHAGSTPKEAALVAEHLVMANLSGHDSHGVGMVSPYAASFSADRLQLNQHAEIVRDAGAVITVEGHRGFGQVIAFEAMEAGIERAKKLGICAVGLRGAHHIGRIGHWAEQCAAAGLISFHFTNVVGMPVVAPFGGIDRRFGTNPFCAAFPRDGQPPLILDFATSNIAHGKTRVAYNKGVDVAPGHLIDHAGQPTVDPKVMHEAPFGSLLTFGTHKGFGLATLCELFGGALSGGYTTHASTLETTPAIMNCMTTVIVDPNAFDAPRMQAEADAFVEWVKASPLAEGTDRIMLPGEPERARRKQLLETGVPIDPTTWRLIAEAAAVCGMPADEIARFAQAYH